MEEREARLNHLLLTRLKLRHFTILRTIEEHRTLGRTAAVLAITQPALTRSLREIEDIFMTRLFERTNAGLKATVSGEAVLRYARLMISHAEATARHLAGIDAGHLDNLRFGFTPHVPEQLLITAMMHVLGRTPPIAMSVREGTTDQLVPALHRRELDGVVGRSYTGELEEDFVQEPIYYQEPCLLVATRSVARLSRGKLDLSRLADLDWIQQPRDTPMRRSIDAVFTSAGLRPPVPLVETHSLRAMQAVFSTQPHAVAIIARDTAQPLIDSGVCAVLPFALHWNLPPVSLFAPRDLARHAVLQSLLTTLRKAAQTLPGGPHAHEGIPAAGAAPL